LESVYQRERLKSNGFRNRRVASICGNLNALAVRDNRIRPPGKWTSPTWGKCCENNAKYFLAPQIKERKVNPWQQCRINCEADIGKAAYKQQEAWTVKEYSILSRWNLAYQPEFDRPILWMPKAHYETGRLNYQERDHIGKPRPLPITWRKCREKAYLQMLRTPEYQEVTAEFSRWELCFIAAKRWLEPVNDRWELCFLANRKRLSAQKHSNH